MDTYHLITPKSEHFEELYNWKIHEKEPEKYIDHKIKENGTLEVFIKKTIIHLNEKDRVHQILVDDKQCILGDIKGYNYNERNQSIEIGYYLPQNNRSLGYGNKMLELFIIKLFNNEWFPVNKIIAVSSMNNIASIKLLEKNGFSLDGKLREQYWIDDKRIDGLYFSLLKREWEVRKI